MTLKDKITTDMTTAMKEKNAVARDILRVIKGEIERAEQDPKKGKIILSDGDVAKIIKKSIAGIKETTNDEAQINVLESYLPKQLSTDEIKVIVNKILTEDGVNPTIKDVLAAFNANYMGRADGKILADTIKEEISRVTAGF